MSNETAGEHYTPREVIRLVVDLLLSGQTAEQIEGAQIPVRTVYDPAAGTGGMLTAALDRITDSNAKVHVFGQEVAKHHVLEADAGISTYVWILASTKPAHRAGKVALFDLFFGYPGFQRLVVEYMGEMYDEFRSGTVASGELPTR